MLFCSQQARNSLNGRILLTLNNTTIPLVDRFKNLGVVLDTNLRFYYHVSNLSKRTYMQLKILYSNRHILNFKTRKKLVESLVISILSYSIVLYYPCLDFVTKSRIQKIQNSCCRFVFGLRRYSHISSKINELQWLKMDDMFTYHLLILTHKMIKSNKPLYLLNKLVLRGDINQRTLRSNNQFDIPMHHMQLFKRSFTYNAVKSYNAVSEIYKNKSYFSFKKAIKCKLLMSQSLV